MNAFSSTELARMQGTQEGAMQDVCRVGAYTSTADGYGSPTVDYVYGAEVACGVFHTRPQEVQRQGEVVVIDTVLRLPLATALDERDRIRVVERFGTALEEGWEMPGSGAGVEVYEIEGAVQRGPSGLRVRVRLVDDGTDEL